MKSLVAKLLTSPRRIVGAVMCVVGAVLLVASFSGALSGSQPIPEATSSPPEVAAATSTNQNAADPPPTIAETPQPTQQSKPNTSGTQNTAASGDTPAEANPVTLQVSLQINDVYKGEVRIQPGQNHCDVLTTALADGIIQSVDMRWYTALESYGVYKINGIGNDKVINWVYEVNDKSPAEGCTKVKPNPGDKIHWKYLK